MGSDQIVADAAHLPALSMVWHDSPYDEHPVADVTLGQNKIWQAVDAIATAGQWDDTVFLLTWDDWGGFDDHVVTPNVEHTPDGVQLAYGPRVPLLMFGGRVHPGIDSRWNSHVSIGKTVLDLLGLPPLGVPRLDQAPSLVDLIAPTRQPPHHPRSAPHHPAQSTTADPHPEPHAPTTSQHLDPRGTGDPARRHHPAPTQRSTRQINPAPRCVSRASQGVGRAELIVSDLGGPVAHAQRPAQ